MHPNVCVGPQAAPLGSSLRAAQARLLFASVGTQLDLSLTTLASDVVEKIGNILSASSHCVMCHLSYNTAFGRDGCAVEHLQVLPHEDHNFYDDGMSDDYCHQLPLRCFDEDPLYKGACARCCTGYDHAGELSPNDHACVRFDCSTLRTIAGPDGPDCLSPPAPMFACPPHTHTH